MFQPLQSEVESRFSHIEAYFRATRHFRGDLSATAKGLSFVQVYSVYEFTVRSVLRVALDSIERHNHKVRDISPSLMAVFLDSELEALRACSQDKIWQYRINLFEKAYSKDKIRIRNRSAQPHDGSHFRYTNLLIIFKVFGINRLPVPRRRHSARVNEVVDHRNLIAHGSETPEEIGRRYTNEEIRKMISQMRGICILLISIFENYCSNPSRHVR